MVTKKRYNLAAQNLPYYFLIMDKNNTSRFIGNKLTVFDKAFYKGPGTKIEYDLSFSKAKRGN